MKRKLIALVILILALLLIPLMASAKGGSCGNGLTYTLDESSGKLTIRGRGALPDYQMTQINGQNATSAPWGNEVKTVVIEEGVTEIGNWTFLGCRQLTDVYIPTTVTTIIYNSFEECSNVRLHVYIDSEGYQFAVNYSDVFTYTTIDYQKDGNSPVKGNMSADITYAVYADGLLVINGTGAMRTDGFDSGDSIRYWRKARPEITKVFIEYGITTIADYSFTSCTSLKAASLPDSITYIGYEAFRNCPELETINMPTSLATLGSYAFRYCPKLPALHLPDNITSCGNDVFYQQTCALHYADKDSQTAHSLGKAGYTFIDPSIDYRMKHCYSANSDSAVYYGIEIVTVLDQTIISFTCPDNTYSIAADAFSGCTELADFTVPAKKSNTKAFQKIGASAFRNCTALERVTLPTDSSISVGASAFSGCTALTDLFLTGSGRWRVSVGDYNEPFENALIHGECGQLSYTLDKDGLLSISGKGQMYSETWPLSKIVTVVIENGAENITSYAFQNCDKLVSVTIPETLESIGDRAFYYCTSLTDMEIPDSVMRIGAGAFFGCSNLESIRLPENLDTINSLTFYNCSSLTAVALPPYITGIGSQSFTNCTGLTAVTIPDRVTSIDSSAFDGCSNLSAVSIPYSLEQIGNNAFKNCSSLEHVYYSGSQAEWQTLQDHIGTGNTCLTGAAIHCNDQTCGTGLSWTLADGVLTIRGTGDMKDYTLPTGVDPAPWKDSAESIRSIRIGEGVTTIGACAFAGCSNLEHVYMPDSLTSINYAAFLDCFKLTYVVIPSRVVNTGNWSDEFTHCNQLTDVFYKGSQANWPGAQYCIPSTAVIHYNCVGGSCGNGTSWWLDDQGLLSFVGKGTVTNKSSATDHPWYEYRQQITSVRFRNGVTNVPDCAFENYYFNPLQVEFSSTVKSIGKWAFGGCSGLTEITLPPYLVTLGQSALKQTAVSSIVVPEGVSILYDYTFAANENLTYVKLPSSLTLISDVCFKMSSGAPASNAVLDTPCGTYAMRWAQDHAGAGIFAEYTVYGHQAEHIPERAATCTEEGLIEHWFCSGCGKHFIDASCTVDDDCVVIPVDPDAHEWDDGVITTPATCCDVGVKTFTCSHNAEHTRTEPVPIDPDAHTWNEGEITTPATCSAEGIKTFTCIHNAEHTTTEPVAIDETAHAWDEGVITTPATCSAQGVMTFTCIHNAEHTRTEDVAIDPNAHTWNEGEITTPATCSTAGVKTFTCAHNAEHTRTEDVAIDPDAHTWNEGVITTPATCSTAGVKTFTCAHNAEHTRTEDVAIDPDAHTWNEGEITTSATCSTAGVKTFTCAHNTEHTRTEPVTIDPDAHKWDEGVITTPATCSTAGVKTFTCAHNAEHTRTEDVAVDPDAHKWDEGVITTPATCRDEGVKTFTCSHNPEHTRTEPVAVDPNAHTPGEPVRENEVPATESAAGSYDEVTYCTICGEEVSREQKPIPQLQPQQPDPQPQQPAGPQAGSYSDSTGKYDVSADGTATYKGPAKDQATVTIPATIKVNGFDVPVTKIADKAFKGKKKLKTVTIGANIKEIGTSAFEGCKKLKTVKGGANVEKIGAKAFKGCVALTKYTIGAKVNFIGKNAFYGCTKLKTITVKSTLLTKSNVKSGAFKKINAKATFKVPKSKKKEYAKWLPKKGTKTVKVK